METQFQNNEAVLVTHYQGLSMPQLDELRAQMREHGIKFKITKNRITKISTRKKLSVKILLIYLQEQLRLLFQTMQ